MPFHELSTSSCASSFSFLLSITTMWLQSTVQCESQYSGLSKDIHVFLDASISASMYIAYCRRNKQPFLRSSPAEGPSGISVERINGDSTFTSWNTLPEARTSSFMPLFHLARPSSIDDKELSLRSCTIISARSSSSECSCGEYYFTSHFTLAS